MGVNTGKYLRTDEVNNRINLIEKCRKHKTFVYHFVKCFFWGDLTLY